MNGIVNKNTLKRPRRGGSSEAGSSGSAEPAWQAFKRLRVTPTQQEPAMHNNNSVLMQQEPPSHGGYSQNDPSSSGQQTPANHRHHQHPEGAAVVAAEYNSQSTPAKQTPGQDTEAEQQLKTPPVAALFSEQRPPDTDYKGVNHILGQLHYQRLQRDKLRQQPSTVQRQGIQQPVGNFPLSSPMPSSQRPGQMGATLRTPPPTRRGKVVNLHTSSKLG